jgi:Sulfite exporter TauE/SafE
MCGKARSICVYWAYLLCGGVPGAIVGAIILEKMKSEKSEAWILLTLGIIIVVSASISLVQFTTPNQRTRTHLLPPGAFLIGAETGFSSAGAGALGTVMLFNFTSLAPAVVVGTDLVFGLIVSTVAGGIHIESCDYLALSTGSVGRCRSAARITNRICSSNSNAAQDSTVLYDPGRNPVASEGNCRNFLDGHMQFSMVAGSSFFLSYAGTSYRESPQDQNIFTCTARLSSM